MYLGIQQIIIILDMILVSDGGETSEGGENRAGVTDTDGIEIYEGGFKAVLKGRSITTYIVR